MHKLGILNNIIKIMTTLDTQEKFEEQPRITFRETIDTLSTIVVNGQPSPALIEARTKFLEILKLVINDEELELVLEQNPNDFAAIYITGEHAQTTSFPDFVLRNFIEIADDTRFPDLSQRAVTPTTPETNDQIVKTIEHRQQETSARTNSAIKTQDRQPKSKKKPIDNAIDELQLSREDEEKVRTKFTTAFLQELPSDEQELVKNI